MENFNDIVQLAVDNFNGTVTQYSTKQANDTIRQALIEANNGKTEITFKDVRDGKCIEVFRLIEEIIPRTVIEGLQGDEFFTTLVDFRNLALGDKNEFITEDSVAFTVAEAANGTQGIRRQRLSGSSTFNVPTTLKVIRIYEELNRVLAGRVDFNKMINMVAEAFKRYMLEEQYTLFGSIAAADLGGTAYFPAAGAYDEEALLDVIEHVEAAAGGRKATIIGTASALRNLTPALTGAEHRRDLYNQGYCGKFYGTNVFAIPQRHKIGTTDFLFDNKELTIIAGDDKPIKYIYEGVSTIIMGDPLKNADLTQELNYVYAA